MEPGALHWCPVAGSEATGTKMQEVLSEHQEMLFHCEGNQALAQVAQRSCRLSLFLEILGSCMDMVLDSQIELILLRQGCWTR